ncbi:tryptophan synthase subunit alpha, partial [Staphylococcus epidermidis]
MIKSFTALPVVAGFGIRTTDHIKDLVKDVDGVVIGSEIVRRFENDDLNQTGEYLREIRQILNNY